MSDLSYSKATEKATTYARHDLCRVPRFVSYLQSKGLQKVSEITEAHVQAHQQHLLEWLSPRTVRHCMYAASGFLSYAVRQGYVRRNVVRNVPKVKAAKNPPRYLSFDEWEKVKEVAQETYLWPLVATAYYAGFRNSELRFLTWPEIDLDRDVITLVNKEGFTLRNRESRTAPLNRELKDILAPLNAAIEAAHAGEAGRGFAVVADEIRKLAEGTKQAAMQIEGMVNAIGESTTEVLSSMTTGTEQVAESIGIVNEALTMLDQIGAGAQEITAKAQEISSATAEQAGSAQVVASTIEEIAATSDQAARVWCPSASMSYVLAVQVVGGGQLQTVPGRFLIVY